MKVVALALSFAAFFACTSCETIKCSESTDRSDFPLDWIDMAPKCVQAMRDQVEEELKASLAYLAMGAHFARDVKNRPGFADFFFDSASEEREHAMKIIEYLLMRGQLITNIKSLIKDPFPKDANEDWNGVSALQNALKLEASVTRKINGIIKECENSTMDCTNSDHHECMNDKGEKLTKTTVNDYHLVDYLSGDFLDEQYKGQRDLASKLSVLHKMVQKFGNLGEYLFDKKLLNKELPVLG